MQTVIDRFEGEHAFLSNFHESIVRGPFGLFCPTVEHAFQACKCRTREEALEIVNSLTPGGAKRKGRRVDLRDNWEDIKVDTMLSLVREKFSIPELAEKLMDTGEAELVEGNTWGDTFWGVCDGAGQNHLGRILMQVRGELVAAYR